MAEIYVRVRTEEQMKSVIQSGLCDVLLLPSGIAEHAVRMIRDMGVKGDIRIFLDLPDIARENRIENIRKAAADAESSEDISGFVVKNIDELGLISEPAYSADVIADPFLYAYNDEAVELYKKSFPGIRFISPDELSLHEMEHLSCAEDIIFRIYGRQRVMFTAQDFRENVRIKGGRYEDMLIMESVKKDRYIILPEEQGYNSVLTEDAVSMIDKLDELPFNRFLIDLSVESGREADSVLYAAKAALEGKECHVSGTFRGHYYKGID